MSLWTEYSQQTPKGTAGSLYDLTAHTVDSFHNLEADGVLLPGVGVVHGTIPGTDIALPKEGATADKFVGVVMYGGSNELDMKNNLIIPKGYTVSVMRSGRVWVKMAEDEEPSYGDPVFLVVTGDEVGCFRAAAGDDTIQINARIVEAGSNGLAAIELFNQIGGAGSGLSTAADVDLSTAPTNGQALKYDSASGKWKPGT